MVTWAVAGLAVTLASRVLVCLGAAEASELGQVRSHAQARAWLGLHRLGPISPNKRIGVAEVLEPTAFPPPAPFLNAWEDLQPVDTAIGSFFVARLRPGPTVTPPPTQSVLDVAAACPELSDWPEGLQIDAPDPCKSAWSGAWTSSGGGGVSADPTVGYWKLSCGALAPVVTYRTPNGDLFGTSQMVLSLVGTTMELRDCAGRVRYMVDERVYHEAGEPNPEACERYGSCDGTVWIQYVVRDFHGRAVARTPYLNLFQSNFDILDPAGGGVIAKVSRMGDWSPASGECGVARRWVIRFSDEDIPGPFARPSERWPLAELLTMASLRDAYRRPSGLAMPTACEARRTAMFLVTLILVAAIACTGGILFFRLGLLQCRILLLRLENQICPMRMRKPSKHESF